MSINWLIDFKNTHRRRHIWRARHGPRHGQDQDMDKTWTGTCTRKSKTSPGQDLHKTCKTWTGTCTRRQDMDRHMYSSSTWTGTGRHRRPRHGQAQAMGTGNGQDIDGKTWTGTGQSMGGHILRRTGNKSSFLHESDCRSVALCPDLANSWSASPIRPTTMFFHVAFDGHSSAVLTTTVVETTNTAVPG